MDILYVTIIAPIIVGIAITLFDHWLNDKR
nr:type I toxin-antitoxin system Fst family toxin [Companilactobacillus kedongensis]